MAHISLFDPTDKVIIVTGATGALAGSAADYLAVQGARVVFLGRNQEKLDAALTKCRSITPDAQCVGLVADVLDRPALEKARTAARHGDVIVSNGRAWLYYFTHPGRIGEGRDKDGYDQRRSAIQVVELKLDDGRLSADRNPSTYLDLAAPHESQPSSRFAP